MTTIDHLLDVSMGNVVGHSAVHKFGSNPSMTSGEWDTIWNAGGVYTGFNAVNAEIVSIVSTSALDTDGGTGLRHMMLYGLDSNGKEQQETVILNGLTPVISSLSYLRLDRLRGIDSGLLEYNQGDITARQSITTAVVFATMPAGYNTTMIACYTIPADKNGYLVAQRASIANKKAAVVDIRVQSRVLGGVFTVGGEASLNSVGTGYIEQTFFLPKKLPPMTDIYIEGNASANHAAVSAFFDILLVDI